MKNMIKRLIEWLEDSPDCIERQEIIDILKEHKRGFETPAAGPWRTDVENAPGDNTPLLYQVWDDSLSLKSFIVSTKYLIQFRKITPVAFAEIDTEGL